MTVDPDTLYIPHQLYSFINCLDLLHNVYEIVLLSSIYSETSSYLNAVKDPEVRLAKVKVDSDFTAPCNTSILYPADGGNMHCFTAVTASAVLDVLGPPYSDPDGRHCTYYLEYPFSKFTGTLLFLL